MALGAAGRLLGELILTDSLTMGAANPAPARSESLFHPVADFIFLGGGSVILLAMAWLLLPDQPRLTILPYVLLATHIINHPHFAYSYQIFYRRFDRKVLGGDLPPLLRARYVFAGIIVPATMVIFFAVSIARGDARMMGYAGNFMVFTVGWHYAKQGYGMIIVDSVLKRQFFSQKEKRILLANAYACWILSYVWVNESIHETNLWDLKYYTFDFPDLVMVVSAVVVSATSVLTVVMLGRKWAANGGLLPVNGIAAYVASLYVWLLAARISPAIVILTVPAFHSLQYQYVVWRYQLNAEKSRERSAPKSGTVGTRWPLFSAVSLRFILFNIIGVGLGFAAFWAIPAYLDGMVAYDSETFGNTMFFFMCWVFINIHHYFLDNVIWRAENPETKKHLFSHK